MKTFLRLCLIVSRTHSSATQNIFCFLSLCYHNDYISLANFLLISPQPVGGKCGTRYGYYCLHSLSLVWVPSTNYSSSWRSESVVTTSELRLWLIGTHQSTVTVLQVQRPLAGQGYYLSTRTVHGSQYESSCPLGWTRICPVLPAVPARFGTTYSAFVWCAFQLLFYRFWCVSQFVWYILSPGFSTHLYCEVFPSTVAVGVILFLVSSPLM